MPPSLRRRGAAFQDSIARHPSSIHTESEVRDGAHHRARFRERRSTTYPRRITWWTFLTCRSVRRASIASPGQSRVSRFRVSEMADTETVPDSTDREIARQSPPRRPLRRVVRSVEPHVRRSVDAHLQTDLGSLSIRWLRSAAAGADPVVELIGCEHSNDALDEPWSQFAERQNTSYRNAVHDHLG